MTSADALGAIQQLSEAVVAKDRATADRVLSDDFTAIGHLGNEVGKETYLNIHFSDERDFDRFSGSGLKAIEVGSCLLVTGDFEANNVKGKPSGIKRMSALVIDGDDGPKIRFWQETPIIKKVVS